jgi:hypothetical protein
MLSQHCVVALRSIGGSKEGRGYRAFYFNAEDEGDPLANSHPLDRGIACLITKPALESEANWSCEETHPMMTEAGLGISHRDVPMIDWGDAP